MMKKVLIQLDTDRRASPFDAIAALDADVDVLLQYHGVTVDEVPGLMQSAMFPRGPEGLVNTAVWIGGARVRDGEALLHAAHGAFFDPFRLSVMVDSNGCNTTASAAVARVRSALDLAGGRAVIVGAGPVGLRAAELLRREGTSVTVSGVPAGAFGDQPYRRASGIGVAEDLGFAVVEPATREELAGLLDGAQLVMAAGPAGIETIDRAAWSRASSIEIVVDFSATQPAGAGGVAATDDLETRDGKRVLGALAVGGPKMRLQKVCVRKLFDQPGQVLDLAGIYDVALELS
jgi:methylenetetrahydrofolate/methylenetetrahydromethanopterin dehydrogenase (NADP+)